MPMTSQDIFILNYVEETLNSSDNVEEVIKAFYELKSEIKRNKTMPQLIYVQRDLDDIISANYGTWDTNKSDTDYTYIRLTKEAKDALATMKRTFTDGRGADVNAVEKLLAIFEGFDNE